MATRSGGDGASGNGNGSGGGAKLLTVEEYARGIFQKFLRGGFASAETACSAADARAHGGGEERRNGEGLPPRGGGGFARSGSNYRRACERFTDLLRKTSVDKDLLKIPLRCLRDEILLRASTPATTATSPSSSSSELQDEVDALFSLFDGVHALCTSLASRSAAGPYETVEQALRLRLFLCVAGDTWVGNSQRTLPGFVPACTKISIPWPIPPPFIVLHGLYFSRPTTRVADSVTF